MKTITHKHHTAKLALADWRLPVHGVNAIHFCARQHINALQIDYGGNGRVPCLSDPGRQKDIISACMQCNVKVIALAGNQLNDIGLNIYLDRSDAKKVQNLIISILDTACCISAPLVFFPSFRQGKIQDYPALIRTAKILRWACREAQDRGLFLGNENDLKAKDAKILIEEVGSSNFRLIFDCYNPIKSGHSALELFESLHNCFASQIHVKDGLRKQDGNISLGNGDGQLATLLSALSEKNDIDYYVLENDYRNNLPLLGQDIIWMASFIDKQQANMKFVQ
jgi:L-ribulose-5-phosphate 3-epimerase